MEEPQTFSVGDIVEAQEEVEIGFGTPLPIGTRVVIREVSGDMARVKPSPEDPRSGWANLASLKRIQPKE